MNVGAYDGDGVNDLAVGDIGHVWLFTGRADGTFARTGSYQINHEYSNAMVDVDNDGRTDVIAAKPDTTEVFESPPR